jgi:hypothetical protein
MKKEDGLEPVAQKNAGITVIEALVILFILAILGWISVIKVQDEIVKHIVGAIPRAMEQYKNAQLDYLSKTGKLAASVAELGLAQPRSKWFLYRANGGGASAATYTAIINLGMKLGGYPPGGGYATIIVMPSGKVVRNRGKFEKRHLPDFK